MSFPPVKTLATVPVSQEIALKFLSTFLSATKSTPYLLPGARLEPTGPAAGSSSSPMIYNLQRVEAGLRGEWLAPVLDLQNGGEDSGVVGALGEGEGDKMEVEGWQDLDEYQREQSIEEGEVGPRLAAVAQEGDEDFEGRVEVEVEEEGEAPKAKKVKTKHERGVNENSSRPLDKNARKAAKKEKRKEDKKKRAAEKLKGKHAEE